MSISDGNHPSPTLLAESFAHHGVLVDQEYEQEIRHALEALEYVVGPIERAGRHGLLRISVDGDASADKLFDGLYEQLQQAHSPALGNYGRDRHFAIGALGAVRPTSGTTNIGDPKVWGSYPPVRAYGSVRSGPRTSDEPDPKVWGSGCVLPAALVPGRVSTQQPTRSSDTAGLGVVVGVLDTKVTSHDYLVGGFVASPDAIEAIEPNGQLGLASAHATFVAGLILLQAPAATVHVKQVLSDDGLCDSVTLHDAIIDIAKEPIGILNLSLGCNTGDDRPPFVLQRAIRKFRELRPGAVIVAAAGNHPEGKKFWPAALPSVLAVTIAAQRDGGRWDESTGYPTGHWVDVAAPGEQVISTFLTGTFERPGGLAEHYNGWAVGDGTSFACAIASGYLARNWMPGCGRAELIRIARHAPVPTTRSGDRPVLGATNPTS
jgi:hypothetical protein